MNLFEFFPTNYSLKFNPSIKIQPNRILLKLANVFVLKLLLRNWLGKDCLGKPYIVILFIIQGFPLSLFKIFGCYWVIAGILEDCYTVFPSDQMC